MDQRLSRPQLNEDTASKLLANVFDACQREQNTIPLSTLESYSEYRREKHGLQKGLLIFILIVFMAMPLCFIAPKFTVTKISAESAKYPQYEIRVEGFIPVSYVASSVESTSLVVSESDDRVFTVVPTENGIMKIKVMLMNRQYNVAEISVTGIDNNSPLLSKSEKTDTELLLYVTDDGLGVDYNAVYAENNYGETILPLRYDEEQGLIVFARPEEDMSIFVPDKKGNKLELVITLA